MIPALHKYLLDPFENHSDVGSVHLSNSCDYDPEQHIYTIASAGADIWGDHDDFH